MSNIMDTTSIRELAYNLWVKRGKPIGSAEADWFEAERQLTQGQRTEARKADEAVKESFPASDPPASGLPDKPPANADAKWAAAQNAKARGKRQRPETPKFGSRDNPRG
jgi:hypothetical protein